VQLLLLLAASLLTLLLLAFFCVIRLQFEGKAIGEPNGFWAAAGGVSLLGFTVAFSGSSKSELRSELHLGRRRLKLPKRKAKAEKPATPKPETLKPAAPLTDRVDQALDGLRGVRRAIALGSTDVDVSYGFSDIVLTGQISGALYALSGALPPQIRVKQTPRWDGVERFELSAAGSLLFSLFGVLRELGWYMLSRRRAVRRNRPEPPARAHDGQVQHLRDRQ